MYPIFVTGACLQGAPLAWLTQGSEVLSARIRGRLWRAPSGELLISLDSSRTWIHGELIGRPSPERLRLLETFLGGRRGILSLQKTRARVACSAVTVELWAADPERLRTIGAVPLRCGNPREILGGTFPG